jgi:hypothetical protein
MSLRLSPRCQKENPLVVGLPTGPIANDDLAELGVKRLLAEPAGIDVCARSAPKLPEPALTPVVDDDLVHNVRERELDGAHRPVRDHETARLDPAGQQVRLGPLEPRCLHHHVRAP